MLERKKIKCDLCIIGGGMSGLSAAISAAREGINVVLMHERPVLGGNASSEIRMWICGALGEDNRETGIIEEIALENLYRNPTKSYAIWNAKGSATANNATTSRLSSTSRLSATTFIYGLINLFLCYHTLKMRV